MGQHKSDTTQRYYLSQTTIQGLYKHIQWITALRRVYLFSHTHNSLVTTALKIQPHFCSHLGSAKYIPKSYVLQHDILHSTKKYSYNIFFVLRLQKTIEINESQAPVQRAKTATQIAGFMTVKIRPRKISKYSQLASSKWVPTVLD